MIKLIVADMDGTLLNSNHKISEENLEAIKKAQEMGVGFAIATGRMYYDVEPFLKKYGIECECIVMNGAEYRDKYGTVLENIDIDKNKALEIFNMIEYNGFSAELYTDKGLYTSNAKEKALIQTAYRVIAFNPQTSFQEAMIIAKEHMHFTDLNYITNIEGFLNSDIRIGKFVAFYENEETALKIKKRLEGIKKLAISSTYTKNVEVNSEGAQKGLILSKVTQKMGITKDEVMVIGDGSNDYSMFAEFPISFAMENAIPEIKKIAKYITDTNDDAGVAKAIYKVLKL